MCILYGFPQSTPENLITKINLVQTDSSILFINFRNRLRIKDFLDLLDLLDSEGR